MGEYFVCGKEEYVSKDYSNFCSVKCAKFAVKAIRAYKSFKRIAEEAD